MNFLLGAEHIAFCRLLYFSVRLLFCTVLYNLRYGVMLCGLVSAASLIFAIITLLLQINKCELEFSDMHAAKINMRNK